MELTAYIRIFRRWAWLIILVAAVAAGLTYINARNRPLVYQANTLIQIGSYMDLTNPSGVLIATGQQLAETYSQLIKTYPILQSTVDKLQLQNSPQSLRGMISTNILPYTSLMRITVTYNDPVQAADIANELAQQLILNSPTNLTKEQEDQLRIIEEEIANAREQLQNARAELRVIDDHMQRATSEEIPLLTQRRSELNTLISTAQTNLSNFLATYNNIQQSGQSNAITVVERALIPPNPIGSSIFGNVLSAAAVAATIVAGLVFMMEYFNDTIRAPSEIPTLLNIPLLSVIAPFGKKRSYEDKLITWQQPRSMISEAYRGLRVNLMYMEKDNLDDNTCHRYIVTSPNPSEGKSVTTANLAITFAITGMRVLLIDADLRRPTQHQLFKLPNTYGLSNALTHMGASRNGTSETSTAPKAMADIMSQTRSKMYQEGGTTTGNGVGVATHEFADHEPNLFNRPDLIYKTEIPNLEVMLAGSISSNPTELLGSSQMQELMNRLTEDGDYDVIIIDTPPVLVVADSSVMANVAKAGVILVMNAGRTRRAAANRALQQLLSLSVPVLGAVLNRLNPRDVDSGYGQYYYYGYYGDSSASKPQLQQNPGGNSQYLPPTND